MTIHQKQPSAIKRASRGSRALRNPVVRILLGSVMVWLPAPLVTKTAHALLPARYAHVWPMVLASVLVFLAYRFFVLRVERRPVTELSMRGASSELAFGVLIGLAMQVLLFGVLWSLRVYRIDGFGAPTVAMLTIVPFYVGVALLEEMVGRGIVFGISQKTLGSVWGVAISSIFFGLVHAPNVGATPIGLLTCTAFGMMFAAAYMATRRLWLCMAIHFAWNYAQSQVFSSLVSGTSDGDGLIRGHLTGPSWLSGGSFGAEGSVVALALALLGFVVLISRARAAQSANAHAFLSPLRSKQRQAGF